MAMERNLITVPCENEVRPEKEDALDFDEDTLQGTQSLLKLTFRYQFHWGITARHRKGFKTMQALKRIFGTVLHPLNPNIDAQVPYIVLNGPFPWYLKAEFVEQSRASGVHIHSYNSHDLFNV